MAGDAGTFILTWPAAATTEAGGATTQINTTGVKASYCAAMPTDVYEVGCVIGTATAATTFVFTVAVDEKIGGTLANGTTPPNSENFCTVTGPASTAIANGTTLKKQVRFRIPQGGNMVFNVTGNPASGTGMFYAICAVAGTVGSYTAGASTGAQAGAGGVGLTLTSGAVTPNIIISST